MDAEALRNYFKPPLVKDFYVEHQEVEAMTANQSNMLRLFNNQITMKYIGKNTVNKLRLIPKPIEKFEQAFYLYPEIMSVINEQNFTYPTPVQCQAWPIIMSGHDTMIVAQTGAGKTLAYILPALIHLIHQSTPRTVYMGPSILILGPTTEVVLRIKNEVDKYVFNGISVTCLHDDVPMESQVHVLLVNNPNIVIATPSRLNDMVGQMAAKLDYVSYLVLDEVDHMLDIGLKTEVGKILKKLHSDKQTIFTSVTWTKLIRKYAVSIIINPLQVLKIGSVDLPTLKTVEQKIVVLKEYQKQNWLNEFLKSTLTKDDKVIMFVRLNSEAEKYQEMLTDLKIDCRIIYGSRPQVEQKKSLSDFCNGAISMLIITNYLSKELNIDNFNIVINYDFPSNIKEYINRVGRCAKAGKNGLAISLFTSKDKEYASSIVSLLEKIKQPVPKELIDLIEK